MEKIRRNEILDIANYEKIRAEFRARVMAMKTHRRVPLGQYMTLVFENRDTVRFQIQEMMRVERIVHEEPILHEINTYNELIPPDGSLSATMFIEVTEYEKIREVMDMFIGLPHHCVYMDVDGMRVEAVFDLEQSSDTRVSAVQYIQFSLEGPIGERFRDERVPATIIVDHPRYSARAEVRGELRASLIGDLG